MLRLLNDSIYNPGMSFKHIDMESALRRLAERRIEDAMKERKFDNLPGSGKPIELEPMPADENARLTWWALRILRGNNVTPDEIVWRKRIDTLKAELAETRSEPRVRALVQQITALAYKLNTLGTSAIPAHDGRAGEMSYLARRFDERVDPSTYLPGARSVVCVAINYHVPLQPLESTDAQRHGRVARYALGDDYHELIKSRLHALADTMREIAPDARTRACVDTAPVMEKELAARAGVGWFGKNGCVINEDAGSGRQRV